MSKLKTYQHKIQAARRDEVVSSADKLGFTGRRFHFIGVGGIGMSGLAKLLIKHKAIITGSDQLASCLTSKLRQIGADIKIGHTSENLALNTHEVVISAAIKEDNPELLIARRRGCKIYKYAQMLGMLMSSYDGIAVSGTHGKSTTTGWLVYLLNAAGMDPSFIIGADALQSGSSSGVGDGKYFIAEACEYDRSFLNLKPKIACILNIEADHLDYYRDEDDIVDAFCEFADGICPGGVLIVNGQDTNTAEVMAQLPADLRCETFGFDMSCDFSAQNIELNNGLLSFDLYHNGRLLSKASISLPGSHNILNALAVFAMAFHVGIEPEMIIELLAGFTGIDRRIMLKGKISDITLLDDYAHHPTEIRASLEAIRQRYQPKRIFCVFQPHQHSRTRFLLDDFTESFKLADVTIVPEIYFVRDAQQAKKEINSGMLVERIKNKGHDAVFIAGFSDICEYLKREVSTGDLVVTMGAGDIWKVADEYIQWLRENR